MELTLKGRFADYLRFELGRRPSTVKQYMWRLEYLEKRFGKSVEDITSGDLRSLKREWTQAAETLKGLIVASHQFHVWGVLEELWPQNGICYVKTPPIDDDSSPPLSIAKMKAILEVVDRTDPYEVRVVFFPGYAGTRIGASASIDERHWDNEDDLLYFRSKSRRKHIVPVHPELARYRSLILSTRPPHKATLSKRKCRIEERVGFEFVAHQLRKTFSTELYNAGIDDRVVKKLIGHKLDVTGKYIDVSLKKMREAVPCLPY